MEYGSEFYETVLSLYGLVEETGRAHIARWTHGGGYRNAGTGVYRRAGGNRTCHRLSCVEADESATA